SSAGTVRPAARDRPAAPPGLPLASACWPEAALLPLAHQRPWALEAAADHRRRGALEQQGRWLHFRALSAGRLRQARQEDSSRRGAAARRLPARGRPRLGPIPSLAAPAPRVWARLASPGLASSERRRLESPGLASSERRRLVRRAFRAVPAA